MKEVKRSVPLSAALALVLALAAGADASAATFGPFANTGQITIPNSGPASPYASTVNVSGVAGTVNKITVTLPNISHTYPGDIDILLVGPGGQKVLLMSDAGGARALVNVSLTFDDSAVSTLPESSQIVSGTYKPTNYVSADTFPSPAPTVPYGTTLSAFNGINPNGTWSLYVFDDASGDAGQIGSGWSMTIGTDIAAPTVNIQSPIDGESYLLNSTVAASYSCKSDQLGPTGIASCTGTVPVGAPVNTGTPGTQSFTVVARDIYNQTTTVTHQYSVLWKFSGFFNKANAGSSIPISFSLGGDQGLAIFRTGSPYSIQVDCTTGESIGNSSKVLSPGATTLHYLHGADQYRLMWQTDRAWAGTCRAFTLNLMDGTTHVRHYDFK